MFSITMIALLVLGCLFVGSSTGVLYESECYGYRFRFPREFSPRTFHGRLYFTPSKGGSRKLLLDNGEAKDPRIQVDNRAVYLNDVNELDEGTFSSSTDDGEVVDNFSLRVLDCARTFTRYYWDTIKFQASRLSEYVEYTPTGKMDQAKVMWNHSDPQTHEGSRGRLMYNVWEMTNLTQADNGYYNFRRKSNEIMSRLHLTVKGHSETYVRKENEQFYMRYPVDSILWTVTYFPEEQMTQKTLMSNGSLITAPFRGRIQVVGGGIEIQPLEIKDAGTFEFKDPAGNVAMTVKLRVKEGPGSGVHKYTIVGCISAAVSICCGCVKWCCCKNSSSENDESTPEDADGLAVYHDDNQLAKPNDSGPPPEYSSRLMNSSDCGEPVSTSLGPSPAAPGGTGDAPPPSYTSSFLSSDPGPTYELKGLTISSAPPSSSASTSHDTYTSDKLNFL